VSDTIDALLRGRDALLPFFRLDEATLAKPYAPGKWTGRQVLFHLLDSETVYFDRIRRAGGDDKPLILGFDETHWSQRLFYDQRSLALAATLFAANRDAVIEIVRLAPPAIQAREGVHNEIGKRSFAQLASMTANHVLHHIDQLHAIAGGKTWPAQR
jgi:hypothetical protein